VSKQPNPVVQLLYRLDELAYVVVQGVQSVTGRLGKRGTLAAGGVLLLIPVVGLLFWLLGGSDEPMTRSELTAGGPAATVRGAALSPDGTTLAYADADGLHLLALETLQARAVGAAAGTKVEELTWSPDGQRLFFVGRGPKASARGLWTLDPTGGQAQPLQAGARLPAVSPDGSRLAFVRKQGETKSIWLMDADGQNASALVDDDRYNHTHPTWITDDRLAYIRVRPDETGAEIVTRKIRGGAVQRLAANFDPRTALCWTPDGRLVFGRTERDGASLWSVRVDPETGEPEEGETKILEESGVAYFSGLSVDREGVRLGFVPVRTQVDAYVADVGAGDSEFSPRRVPSSSRDHWPVAWSEDGGSLLLRAKQGLDTEVLIQPIHGGDSRSVANGILVARSPDGSLLFETPDRSGLMRASPLTGEPEPLGNGLRVADTRQPKLRCPQRQGEACILAVEKSGNLHFYSFDPHRSLGRGRELARIGLTGRDFGWNVSADGGRVAVVNGGRTIKLVNLHNGSVRKVRIAPGIYSRHVAWDASGSALFVGGMILHGEGGHALYRVSLSGQSRLLWRTTDRWFGEPVPSPDGKQVALAARTTQAQVWMLEHF
jgi:Tol biopolymer transport system component